MWFMEYEVPIGGDILRKTSFEKLWESDSRLKVWVNQTDLKKSATNWDNNLVDHSDWRLIQKESNPVLTVEENYQRWRTVAAAEWSQTENVTTATAITSECVLEIASCVVLA